MVMQRRQAISWTLLGMLAHLTVGFGAQAGPPETVSRIDAVAPAVVQIRGEAEPLGLSSSAAIPSGIRTYGKGATRLDPSALEVVAADASTDDESVPSVDVSTKISGTPMAGSVTGFTISPDGQTAVYIADQDTASRFELYSTPVDGSASPTKISSGLTFGSGDEGVSAFQISADSTQVVFTADPRLGGGSDDIFSVPIDGSASPVQLNADAAAPVTAFGVSPDSSIAGFFGTDTVFGAGTTELYSATIGVASSATQVSDAGDGNAAGAVVFADFSPDSAWMVYAADAIADEVFQWFSVPTGASGPGSDVRISNALTSVELMAITPDSSRVAYTSDDGVAGVMGIWAKPIAGGTKTRLAPGFPSGATGANFLAISPDGARVAYLADQNTAGVVEVYSAIITVADSGTRLNAAMSGTQSADTLNISPDSATVLYEADQDTAGTYELYAAPIDASSGPSTLHGMTPPDNAGFFAGLGTPIIGTRAVYPVIGSSIDLYSVPCDGSAPFVRINDAVVSGDTLFSAYLPASATRLIAYGVGAEGDLITEQIYAAPIRGDLPPEQLNVTAGVAQVGVLGYEITADENHAVYLQDQDTDGKPELYSVELDSDVDSVVNGLDNCPYVANGSQDPVVFGQTVVAASKTSFAWNDPTELRFVRGPLGSVDVYATDDSGTLADAATYADADTPSAGSGYYYLFAPDCTGRSYQTEPGAEPDRDLAALP